MMKVNPKGKLAKVVAAGAAVAVGVSALALAGTTPASADPPAYNALVGVGSDTTQDIMNALSGFNQNAIYDPVFSDSSPRQTLASFDAVPPSGVSDGCITTRVKAPTFARPNGSSGGQRALSRALDGGVFGPNPTGITAQQCAEPGKAISGQVDFARSSSPASGGAGTVLTFIPFGRDALTFAYVRAGGGAAEATLTTAQLRAAYANNDPVANPTTVNGVVILPCGIQSSSGTYGSWNTMMAAGSGTPSTQENVATTVCRDISTATHDPTTGRLQENYGQGLADKAAALATYDPDGAGSTYAAGHFANAQVIVGFSASNFIAQTNGVVNNQLAGVALGAIDALGVPTQAATPSGLEANPTFYASTTYGRDVYNVVSQVRITGAGSTGMKELFITNRYDPDGAGGVDAGSVVIPSGQPGRGLPANHVAVLCRSEAQTTVRLFGFQTIDNCGSVTMTAGSRSGTF